MNEVDTAVMGYLSIRECMTVQHLHAWLGAVHIRSLYRSVKRLEDGGYVDSLPGFHPSLYVLTRRGCSYLGIRYRDRSPAVYMQYVFRNHVELFIRDKGISLATRSRCYEEGLNPSFGEYLGLKNDEPYALVVCDDYGMPVRRFKHMLERVHYVRDAYYKKLDSCGMRVWESFARQVFIFTHNAYRQSLIQSHIDNELKSDLLKAEIDFHIDYIRPLWSLESAAC